MNDVYTHYPFADCVEADFLPRYIGQGFFCAMRGLAGALLAPIEVLKHVQRARRVERKTRLSWLLAAAMYVCASQIWSLSKGTVLTDLRWMEGILIVVIAVALAVVNGVVQRARIEDAQITSMFHHLERVA